MKWLCNFRQCQWHYLGAFEQADPTLKPDTQGQRGLYQCICCKTISIGNAIDPNGRFAKIKSLLTPPSDVELTGAQR